MAWFQLENHEDPVALSHGELIGRLPTAHLRIDDGRISEAHAMVSLRGRSLMLLALRGRFEVRGRVVAEAELVPDLRLTLAPGVELHCCDVQLPDRVLGLRPEGGSVYVPAGTTSLHAGPPLSFEPRYRENADAVLWSLDEGWRIRIGEAPPRAVEPGATFEIGATSIHAEEVPLDEAGGDRTEQHLRPPLVLAAAGEGARLVVGRADPVHIGGTPGALLGALCDLGPCPPWRDIAARIWVDDRSSDASIRRRFDATLARLRQRLRELGVEERLVALDGAGGVVLAIGKHDRIERVP